MASKPTQPTKTRKLHVDMTLAGHERAYDSLLNGDAVEDRWGLAICYFPDGQQIASGSGDKTTRLWDLRTGKESKEARIVSEYGVRAVAVSRDGRWVITASGGLEGELKACEVKTGIVKIFEGHPEDRITCIDISVDSQLVASRSWDGTTRIWSLDTGKLVAGPLKCSQFMGAVRFSRNSKKFVATSHSDTGVLTCVEVWDIETQKMDVRVEQLDEDDLGEYPWPATPVFWTTQDRAIVVTAFLYDDDPFAINELDASTLGTVGAPFKGHTEIVMCLELSFDCALLVSVSIHSTVKFWAFDSRQLIASFDTHSPLYTLILSPDVRNVAYTTDGATPHKICICDIPPDILADVSRSRRKEATTSTNPRGNALDSDATTRPVAVLHNQATTSSATRPLRHSPTIPKHKLSVLRHLRKLLPSSFNARAVPIAHTIEPRDPLDRPATSSRLLSHVSPLPSSPTQAHPVSLSPTPTTIRNRLRQLSNWWPIRTGSSLPPIVDVPLAPGRLRHAAAGARTGDISSISDEDDSRPPSPSPHSQQPPTGGHGRGRLCGCF